MIDLNKRLVEVDEILNYLSKEDLLKIPEDVRNIIKENKDNKYNWSYDETKHLKEQNLCRDTIIILSYLNMEYLLNQEQKELMEQIHKLNDKKSEEEKQSKYSPNKLFKDKDEKIDKPDVQRNEMVIYKKSFLSKIKDKILRIFRKH